MIRIVDKNEKAMVQKVVDRKGNCVRYQVIVGEPGNTSLVIDAKTLQEARQTMKWYGEHA